MSNVSIQELDGVVLMDGEEILHDFQRHWVERMELGLMNVLKPIRFIVTTERVIKHKQTLTKSVTSEYPIRDIHELKISTNNNNKKWLDRGSISFSIRDETVVIDGIQRSTDIGNSIRERQRQLAE